MGFFGSLWDGVKGIFSGGGDFVECFTTNAWRTGTTLFFGPGRLPLFSSEWWLHESWAEKKLMLRTWWYNLGCLQSIVYILTGVLLMFLLGGFIFFGADILLDVEDLGIFVEGLGEFLSSLFNDVYDMFQIMFDWSVYLGEFLLIGLNPIADFIMDTAKSLGFSPLPTYIIIGELTAIIFLAFIRYIYPRYIYKAGSKYPKMTKIYKYLNYPLKFIVKALKSVFGTWIAWLLDIALLPARILLMLVDAVLSQIF